MKKLIIFLLMSCIYNLAWSHPPHRHSHNHNHNHWVAPLVLGGVLGAVIVNQQQVPPPIIYQYPPQPMGYQYIQVYDYSCYCYRWVLTPIN